MKVHFCPCSDHLDEERIIAAASRIYGPLPDRGSNIDSPSRDFKHHPSLHLHRISRSYELCFNYHSLDFQVGVTSKRGHLYAAVLHCYVSVCGRAHQSKFNPTTIVLLFHLFPEAFREQYSPKAAVEKPIFWHLYSTTASKSRQRENRCKCDSITT